MRKIFVFIIPFFLWSFLSLADTSRDIKVDIQTEPLSPEEFNKFRPSQITYGHSQWLLQKMGLEIAESEYKLLKDLEDETKKRKGIKRRYKDSRLNLDLIATGRYMRGQSFGRTALHSFRGFPLESFLFYTAVGTDMVKNAYLKSLEGGRVNPRWAEDFIDSISTPVGLFSFFCFVFFSQEGGFFYSKILLGGFVFKKGPFKGYQIQPLISTPHIEARLRYLRKVSLLPGMSKSQHLFSRLQYSGYRGGVRFTGFLGSPFGMAAGMFASNIVHEVEYMFGHSEDFKQCVNKTIKSEDAHLACDLFWGGKWWYGRWFPDVFQGGQTELGSTVRGWMPDLLSLILSSTVSHKIIDWSIKGGVYGTYISSHLVKGLSLRFSKRIPTKMLTHSLWLTPIGKGKIAYRGGKVFVKGTFHLAKGVAQRVSAKLFKRNAQKISVSPKRGFFLEFLKGLGWGIYRIFNLVAFFHIEEHYTGKLVRDPLKGDLKANELKYSIQDFTRYYDITSETSPLICNEGGCRYHPSILSLMRISRGFSRWRDHQTAEFRMSLQSWRFYVMKMLGAIEQTYDAYKRFFRSSEGYETFYNKRKFFSNKIPEEVQLYVRSMIERDILLYFYRYPYKDIPEKELSYKVLSMHSHHFLKPDIDWDKPDEEHLKILQVLFWGAEPGRPLDKIYDDFDRVFEEEKQGLIQSLSKDTWYIFFTENKQSIISGLKSSFSSYFTDWEQFIRSLREGIENFRSFNQEKEISQSDWKELWAEYFFTVESLRKYFYQNIYIPVLGTLPPDEPILGNYEIYAGAQSEANLQRETTPLIVRQVHEHLKLLDDYLQPAKTYLEEEEKWLQMFPDKQEQIFLDEIRASFSEYFKRWEQLFQKTKGQMESYPRQFFSEPLGKLFLEYISSVQSVARFFFENIYEPVLQRYEMYAGVQSEANLQRETTHSVIKQLYQHLLTLDDYIQTIEKSYEKSYEKHFGYLLDAMIKLITDQKILYNNFPNFIDELFEKERVKKILTSEAFLTYYMESIDDIESMKDILLTEELWVDVRRMENALTLFDKLFERESIEKIIDHRTERILRSKVLASALEYLNTLIEIKSSKPRGVITLNIARTRELESKLEQPLPHQVLRVFYRLGPDNIFARLYARTFYYFSSFPDEFTFDHPVFKMKKPPVPSRSEVTQIRPVSQGMGRINIENAVFVDLSSGNETYPFHLGRIKTPYLMDFIIASAVCGPDLSEVNEHRDSKFQIINNILKAPNSQGAFERVFENLGLDDVMHDIPVFSKGPNEVLNWILGSGLAYMFYPPRIVDIDEKDRIRICHQVRGEIAYQESVYDGDFQVRDNRVDSAKRSFFLSDGDFQVGEKTYNNLLYLVLDFVGRKQWLRSEEEFEIWWKDKVIPYYQFLMIVINREYKNVMEAFFLRPFFHTGIKPLSLFVEWNPLKSNGKNPSGKYSLGGNFATLNSYPMEGGELFPFPLPKGTSHNVYFELNFWKNIILHFSRFHLSESELDQLEDKLTSFIEIFKPNTWCSEAGDFLQDRVQYCRRHLRDFLSGKEELQEMLDDIVYFLEVRQNKVDDYICSGSRHLKCHLGNRQRFARLSELYSRGKSFDISIFDGQSPEWESMSLPDLLVEYSVIRLYSIFDGSLLSYAHALTEEVSDTVKVPPESLDTDSKYDKLKFIPL